MVREHDRVVLMADLPQQNLVAGDIGTVVLIHRYRVGYEVKFVALNGETVAVVSVAPAQVRPIARREIAHARLVAVPA